LLSRSMTIKLHTGDEETVDLRENVWRNFDFRNY